LSGKPVTKRSTEVIRYLSQKSGKAFPIIGVGVFILQKMLKKN
jgi:dihydroorotate dehydrogenase